MRIPQIAIDQSGLIMTRPDSFAPQVDIYAGEKYIIFMDMPGISLEDIVIYRQNIMTIVKGSKRNPYTDEYEIKKMVKQERKYGDFTLTFKIPEVYERKWKSQLLENGVMIIIYEKDVEETEN